MWRPDGTHIVAEHDNARSVISIPMRVGANGKILGVLQGMQAAL